jgi:hypothetical protein
MKFFQHDGLASRKPEDRGDLAGFDRTWMYAAGKQRLGSMFTMESWRRDLKGLDPDRHEGVANVVVGLVALAFLGAAFWWVQMQNGGMGAAGERAWTRAATGGSGPHPSTLTRDVNGNGNAGGGR